MILTTSQREALRFATPGDASYIRTALHEGAEIVVMKVSDEMSNECTVFCARIDNIWFGDLRDGDIARALHPVTRREVVVRICDETPHFVELIDAESGEVHKTGKKFLIPKQINTTT